MQTLNTLITSLIISTSLSFAASALLPCLNIGAVSPWPHVLRYMPESQIASNNFVVLVKILSLVHLILPEKMLSIGLEIDFLSNVTAFLTHQS